MSSDTPDTPESAAPYNETEFHDSPYDQLGHRNLSWLATTSTDISTIVDVARIRHEKRQVYAAIMKATADYTKTRILRFVIMRFGTVTYDDLDGVIHDKSKRTVKSKVAELRDDGVLSVGDGRPAAIGFVDDDVALLCEDVLSFIE